MGLTPSFSLFHPHDIESQFAAILLSCVDPDRPGYCKGRILQFDLHFKHSKVLHAICIFLYDLSIMSYEGYLLCTKHDPLCLLILVQYGLEIGNDIRSCDGTVDGDLLILSC